MKIIIKKNYALVIFLPFTLNINILYFYYRLHFFFFDLLRLFNNLYDWVLSSYVGLYVCTHMNYILNKKLNGFKL